MTGNTFTKGQFNMKEVRLTDSTDAYLLNVKKADVKSLLTGKQMSLHAEQVKQTVERIDVVKIKGKCGLSYKEDKEEAAYSLENMAINHGNALELTRSRVNMTCAYNSIQTHALRTVKGSMKRVQSFSSHLAFKRHTPTKL